MGRLVTMLVLVAGAAWRMSGSAAVLHAGGLCHGGRPGRRRLAQAQCRQSAAPARQDARAQGPRGWPDAGFEEKAYAALQDERIAALDAQANDLLAKLDALARIEPAGEPDCAKLQELTAASLELQATVKAKAAYMLAKLDQMLAGRPRVAPAEPKSQSGRGAQGQSRSAQGAAAASAAEAAAATPQGRERLATRTKSEPSREVAIAPPPPPSARRRLCRPPSWAPEEDGYTIDEIMAASAGFFGKVSANLGAVIEYLFKNSGRPTGYVLGTEGGGAFLAGVRYGSGTLYMRAGGTQQTIYWHGPSIGTDFGAAGLQDAVPDLPDAGRRSRSTPASRASTGRPTSWAASAPPSSPTAA